MSAELKTDNEPQSAEAKQDIHDFDVAVGARLRQRRLQMGLTQEKLGTMLGLTFQQVQKYERGVNRIAASRLFDIAKLLEVPLTYFYADMPTGLGFAETGQEPLEGGAAATSDKNHVETSELLNAYYNIKDQEKRRRILDLIHAMSEKD